jgi:hypothetical protein
MKQPLRLYHENVVVSSCFELLLDSRLKTSFELTDGKGSDCSYGNNNDNQMGAEAEADPATAIGGGNIVIHKAKSTYDCADVGAYQTIGSHLVGKMI